MAERKVSKLHFFCHCEPRRWRRRDGYDRSNLLIDRGLLCRSFLTPRNDNQNLKVFGQALHKSDCLFLNDNDARLRIIWHSWASLLSTGPAFSISRISWNKISWTLRGSLSFCFRVRFVNSTIQVIIKIPYLHIRSAQVENYWKLPLMLQARHSGQGSEASATRNPEKGR